MPFAPAQRRTLFRLEATSVVATVAPVMFAEVALGLAVPTARMYRFPTTSVSAMTMHSRHPTGRLQAAA